MKARLVSGKRENEGNKCNGCVRCCVEPGIEVPKAGGGGEPLAELLVKSPGQRCFWIGVIQNGILGCTVYHHPYRPEVCITYVCEELLSNAFS